MKFRFLTILIFAFNLNSFGQNSKKEDCYEIKYLDFFGLDQVEAIRWPEPEINGLMKMDFKKDRGDSTIKTNFIIPSIIYQLKEYHPNCKTEIDTLYFNQISELYLKIREIDKTEITNKSIAEKIDFMCNDFYKQVENVNYLPKMTMTFDDGPFYGVEFEQKIELKPVIKKLILVI